MSATAKQKHIPKDDLITVECGKIDLKCRLERYDEARVLLNDLIGELESLRSELADYEDWQSIPIVMSRDLDAPLREVLDNFGVVTLGDLAGCDPAELSEANGSSPGKMRKCQMIVYGLRYEWMKLKSMEVQPD